MQSDPYVDPVTPVPQFVYPQSIPTTISVQCNTFYDIQSIQFTEPVWVGDFPGETGALMVGELGGDLFLLEPVIGGFKKTVFGHIPAAKASGNDGLLGLAFDPNFKNNYKYYAYYNTSPKHGLLQERMASADFKRDEGYSRNLLTMDTGGLVSGHNGGDAHFGNDGYLYLSLGDNSLPWNYVTDSQNLHFLYGKMIRIDVHRKDAGLEYGIPSDNPFSNSTSPGIRKEIYAYGFRNPWRWNFDPVGGRLFLADVGNVYQEEINDVVKGANYGWRTMEGFTCFNDSGYWNPLSYCNTTGLTPPLAAITRPATSSAIIGGSVFRGDPTSPYYGSFIFGDFSSSKIYAFRPELGAQGITQIGKAPTPMSSFGTDSKGNIYLVGYYDGIIYRLDHPYLTAK